jgi:hypothetical protein
MRVFSYWLVVLLVIGFLFGCKKNAPIKSTKFDFDKNYSITSSFDEASSILLVDINLADNLHAYADGEKIGKPVTLEIAPKNNWLPDGPLYIPPGEKKMLKDLGESVVLTGKITIKQKVRKGSGNGEALLNLQVCTDNICDRPRTHTLPIK